MDSDCIAPDGWELHRREQLTSGVTATPEQRLESLEDAIAFAFQAGALPRHTQPEQGPHDPSRELGPSVSWTARPDFDISRAH